MLDFRTLQALMSKQRSDIGAFATTIQMNQNNRITHRNAPAHDATESQSSEIVAIVQIGRKKLKIRLLRFWRRRDMPNNRLEQRLHIVVRLVDLANRIALFGAGINYREI